MHGVAGVVGEHQISRHIGGQNGVDMGRDFVARSRRGIVVRIGQILGARLERNANRAAARAAGACAAAVEQHKIRARLQAHGVFAVSELDTAQGRIDL